MDAHVIPSSDTRALRRVLIAVCSGQFLMPFMMSGASTLLPSMGADLHLGARELGLVVTVYALAMAIFNLTMGRVGDLVGRRRVFLWGISIFSLMSLGIALEHNIQLVLMSRFFQGMGAAMISASSLAIIVACVPPSMRGRYLGLSSSAVYAGTTCGPLIAGFVIFFWGWRWIFLGLVPFGLLIWFLMYRGVKNEWRSAQGEHFDWRGFFFYAVSIAVFTLGAAHAGEGWTPLAAMALGFLGLVLFVLAELKNPEPLLEMRLFVHNRVFALSSLAAFINYGSTFGVLFFMSLYLQNVRGFLPEDAGLILSVQPCFQVFLAPLCGRLADRYGSTPVSTSGIALCGLGLVLLAFLGHSTPLWYIFVVQAITGIGFALFVAPNTSAIMGSVETNFLGQASGLVGTMRTLGMLMSMVVTTVTMGVFLGNMPVTNQNADTFLLAMKCTLIFFGVLNLLGIFCSLARGRTKIRG